MHVGEVVRDPKNGTPTDSIYFGNVNLSHGSVGKLNPGNAVGFVNGLNASIVVAIGHSSNVAIGAPIAEAWPLATRG